METLSIYGSCMSRDAFRLYPVDGIELKSYVARQSVHSAVAKPPETTVRMEDIENLSPFNQRMVYQDINKTTFDILRRDESKWLLVDLIDERFSLVHWGGDTHHAIKRACKKQIGSKYGTSPTNF